MTSLYMKTSPETAAGMLKLMVFLMAVLLILWGLNIFRHIRGGWTTQQKIVDIIGAVLLVIAVAATAAPLLRFI